MRKSFTILLVMVLCASVFSGIVSAAPTRTEINVIMDGKRLPFPDARPFVDENNRTLVPVRFVAENLGAKVAWHDDVDRVDISLDGKYISLTIGEKKALVNGEEVAFDTAAVIRDNRTFVPLRFVSDALGEQVEWDGLSRYVYVGEKVFLTPEELGIAVESVEDYRKYYGNQEFQDYFLRDIHGHFLPKNEPYQNVYVISVEQLPVKIGDTVIYDIWKDGRVVGLRASTYVKKIYFLQDEFFPRDRDSVFGKDVKLEDGTLEQQYAIVTPKDRTLGVDEDYKTFALDDVLYVGFVHIGDSIVLLKNPF